MRRKIQVLLRQIAQATEFDHGDGAYQQASVHASDAAERRYSGSTRILSGTLMRNSVNIIFASRLTHTSGTENWNAGNPR